MKNSAIINIAVVIVLVMIMFLPVILSYYDSENFIELYLNDYSNLDAGKEFTFTIRNQGQRDIVLDCFVLKYEDGNLVPVSARDNLRVRGFSKVTFSNRIDSENARYIIYIPQTDQSLHFWSTSSG